MTQADAKQALVAKNIVKTEVQIAENANHIARLIRVVEVAESEQAHVIKEAAEAKVVSTQNRERIIRLESK